MFKKALKCLLTASIVAGTIIFSSTMVYAQNNPLVGQCCENWDLAAQQTQCGRHIDVVQNWIDFGTTLDGDLATYVNTIIANGSIPELTIQPQNGLAAINNGSWDTYLNTLAQQIKNCGAPEFWVRPMQECNADFFPWGIATSGNTNAMFISAYQRIVNIFRAQGATNVKFEYNVNFNNKGSATFLGGYPGDSYVDFMGMDGYNWGTGADWGSTWQTWDQVFFNVYNAIKVKNKPIIVSEYGCGEPGGSKSAWITDAFNQVRNSGNYDLVKAMIYFDYSGYTPDFQIDTSTAARSAYNAAINYSPSSGANVYEAESGTLSGGAQVQSATNASGGKVVGNINATNAYVQVNNVNGGTGGTAQLVIRFANGYTDNRSLSLYVNGTKLRQLTFAPTGSWNTFTNSAVINITLNSGTSNTIKIQKDSADVAAADIDDLTVTPAAATNAHTGTHGLKATVSGTPSWNNFYQAVSSVPTNTNYVASFWIKGSGKITLRVMNASWSTTLKTVEYTATSTWTQCTLPTFNTGSNTSLVFVISDSSTTAGTLYIDDCFLGVSGSTNKLANPGFESGTGSWTNDNTAKFNIF